MSAFRPFELTHTTIDHSADPFPTVVCPWSAPHGVELADACTHFGFIHTGPTILACAAGEFELATGMYFAVPGRAVLRGGSGLAITRRGFRGFFHLGGPIEATGRLRYIDGCTDSLLVPPVKLGDPCLNLLHIPPHTRQSSHTHPSLRVGLIVNGSGRCVTPHEEHPLKRGLAFVIPADYTHCFHTDNEPLLVIAYHPDSDFGPTDECHPMVNRTILPEVRP